MLSLEQFNSAMSTLAERLYCKHQQTTGTTIQPKSK